MKFIFITIATFCTSVAIAQHNNPYEVFGHNSTIEYKERPVTELLLVRNSDTASDVKALAFDMENRKVILLGANNKIIQKLDVEPQQFLRWLSVDPLAHEREWVSPYNFVQNNPINRIDPTGALDDFVQDNNTGEISWDKNANSQATTKQGQTYLGKTLTFTFNSYIDGKLWDGPTPPFIDPAGDKLTSIINITGVENAAGELTNLSATKSIILGKTPVGAPRPYYPGMGDGQNKFGFSGSEFSKKGLLTATSLNFEQHASVSRSEEIALNQLGYNIVNVAQRLTLNYANNKLSVSSYTDVFPSATLTMNGTRIMYYPQPSFQKTHSAPVTGYGTSTVGPGVPIGSRPIYDIHYKTAMWYRR